MAMTGNDLEYYNTRRAEGISAAHHGDGLMLFEITEIYKLLKNYDKIIK